MKFPRLVFPSRCAEISGVLVLEDNEEMLKLYRLTMAAWQLPVQLTFVNVFEAQVIIGRSQPDLLNIVSWGG